MNNGLRELAPSKLEIIKEAKIYYEISTFNLLKGKSEAIELKFIMSLEKEDLKKNGISETTCKAINIKISMEVLLRNYTQWRTTDMKKLSTVKIKGWGRPYGATG